MNKFEVGDKVKVIKTEEIGTIDFIDSSDISTDGSSNHCYNIEFNNRYSYYTVHDIELVQEILTEKEKEYLSGVIRPFRDIITSICKQEYSMKPLEFIEIYCKYGDTKVLAEMVFPEFEKGKYYKNMETNKEYTLQELGL